jgi:hypothetical protein
LDIDPENVHLKEKEITKYYKELAKMYYYKNVEFIVSNGNPKTEIKDENICFFVPFNQDVPKNKLYSILFPDLNKVHILFDRYNQFMIPTKD